MYCILKMYYYYHYFYYNVSEWTDSKLLKIMFWTLFLSLVPVYIYCWIIIKIIIIINNKKKNYYYYYY